MTSRIRGSMRVTNLPKSGGSHLNPLGSTLQTLLDAESHPIGLPCRTTHKMTLVAWEDDFVAERCVLCGQVKVIHKKKDKRGEGHATTGGSTVSTVK